MEETTTPWILIFLLPTAILFVFIAIVKVVERLLNRRNKDDQNIVI